ncbi:CAP-associated domain-containing protein [Jeotgalibaca arthritidis]|uniref:CAP-associated domain-containing protein n=1 Tax=Jeotgalibaca arthritidis TaxID=1868794 RepID=A0A6G7KBQ3_9LACT|nr:CAP-associated domain-containing protein [Jeotgalibaca arthritidis]QII82686.1 hypothetical protein G7057_09730 [Jeotgalibaca arthritidis]
MIKQFIASLLFFLLALYYIPIFMSSPDYSQPKIETNQQTMSLEIDGVYPLPVSGYEHYLGQSVADYQSRYGDPEHMITSEQDPQTSWWSYLENSHEYVQIEVNNQEIQSIFVLGDAINTGSLKIGMSRENVLDETQLGEQFMFSHSDRMYRLTLSKRNMKLFPLVEFDNQSFAILYFYPDCDEIYAIRYLTYEKILGLNYYFIEEMNSDEEGISIKNRNRLANDQINQAMLEEYINVLRLNANLAPYPHIDEGRSIVNDLLRDDTIDFQSYKELTSYRHPEFPDQAFKLKYMSGTQVYDPAMKFGLFYSTKENQRIVLNENNQDMSIAIEDDNLLLFVNESK